MSDAVPPSFSLPHDERSISRNVASSTRSTVCKMLTTRLINLLQTISLKNTLKKVRMSSGSPTQPFSGSSLKAPSLHKQKNKLFVEEAAFSDEPENSSTWDYQLQTTAQLQSYGLTHIVHMVLTTIMMMNSAQAVLRGVCSVDLKRLPVARVPVIS